MPDETKKLPEHEKLKAVQADAQVIGDFIEWLGMHEFTIAQWVNDRDFPVPLRKSTSDILAEYFGIDLTKLEAEKRQLLDDIRMANHLVQ